MTDSTSLWRAALPQVSPSEQLHTYRAIANASSDAMLIAAPEAFGAAAHIISYVNEPFARLIGYSPAEIVDQPLTTLESYAASGDSLVPLWQAMAEERAITHTWSWRSQAGKLQNSELSLVPLGSSYFLIILRATAVASTREILNAEVLTRSSQLLLRPAGDFAAQQEYLRATLSTLLFGLDGDYLALCKFGPAESQISSNFCIEVVTPELLEEHINSDASKTMTHAPMRLSPQLLERLSETGRATASANEVTTGILTGTFTSYHLERLSTSAGPWGFITFGTREQRAEWRADELWLLQTAVEMISHVIQRWEGEGVVRAAQASLEKQVQQRTAMVLQTVESLQYQISERKRAEMEVRRRLNTERALRDISTRLMKVTNFDEAAAATLADIGEKLVADTVLLLKLQPDINSFIISHRWLKLAGYSPVRLQGLMAKRVPLLLRHLEDTGYFLSAQTLDDDAKADEISLFQSWFNESILILPLHVSGELAALLICCDAEQLYEEEEESIHFVQSAAGMLSGMLRIDQMMKALEKRVAEQTEELAAFFNMAVLASGTEHATETLAAALSMVKEIGNCDAVCVHIMSPDGAALQLAYQIGLDAIDHRHLLRISCESTLYQRIGRNSTPIFVTQYNPIELETRIEEFQSYFGAPMAVRNNVQGLLSCYWYFVHSVSVNQMSLLTALADQLGIILENQRLHRHAQEVGVVHERQRLARELHDSVTQSMYGVMIFARAAREALEDNAFDRLADCLSQVEGASLRSLKEMRLLLYQLRPLALESQGVVEAIRNRVELVERRLGVEVDMQMTPIVGVSHSVEEALYHIAMESLNNILKHADADRVGIQLQLAGTQAELRVTDDGVGFDLDQVTQGMGLSNMRERISALGGELHIHTRMDEGTTILVQIPLE